MELGLIPQDSATWGWIKRYAHNLDHLIEEHKQAHISFYPLTDVLVMSKELMDKYGSQIEDDKGMLSIQRPKTQEIVRAQMEAIFHRFPDLSGLTTRFWRNLSERHAVPHGIKPGPYSG